jgi:hypothetical protein
MTVVIRGRKTDGGERPGHPAVPENIDEEIDHAVAHNTDFHQFMLYWNSREAREAREEEKLERRRLLPPWPLLLPWPPCLSCPPHMTPVISPPES